MAKTYGNFTDFIDFSRASSGTYLGSDGLLKTAADNVPRVEYDANGVLKGLLIEEQRTNLVPYSEDFTDASWAKTRSLIALDAVGPDGQANSAATLSDDSSTGNNDVRLQVNCTVSTTTDYTFSIFAKADQLSWMALRTTDFTTPSNQYSYFDLSSGTLGTIGADHTATIEDMGNNWYRCSITFTTDVSDTTGAVQIFLADADGDPNVDLDGTSSVLIYGAQFEAGSFPTSYIPTSGATATRSADIASIATANFGYNKKAGTVVVVEVDLPNLGNTGSGPEGIASFVANAAVENVGLYKKGFSTASQVRYEVRSSNASQATIDLTVPQQNSKMAYSFAADRFNLCVDGGLGTEDTSGNVPSGVTDLSLGNIYSVSGNNFLNGHIKSIKYIPRRNSNTQLQEFTS